MVATDNFISEPLIPVDVAIVSYGKEKILNNCLHYFRSTLDHEIKPRRVMVIDNSVGSVDAVLNKYVDFQVLRSPKNLGKVGALRHWWPIITGGRDCCDLIIADGDVGVNNDVIAKLMVAAAHVRLKNKLGLLAPVLVDDDYVGSEAQFARQRFSMHGQMISNVPKPGGILVHHSLAGCLLYVGHDLLKFGPPVGAAIYGGDDNWWCRTAVGRNLFSGIVLGVEVRHFGCDDVGYQQWKAENIERSAIPYR